LDELTNWIEIVELEGFYNYQHTSSVGVPLPYNSAQSQKLNRMNYGATSYGILPF